MISEVFKIVILISILYVWVVRYQNIVDEFNSYRLPPWLRDLVGILKISFGVMLFSNNYNVVLIGVFGIIILMCSAQVVHFNNKTTSIDRLPSLALIILSILVLFK